MTKQQVLEFFCSLSTKVMTERFNCEIPADCFCGEDVANFQFDKTILTFIEDAVESALSKDRENNNL